MNASVIKDTGARAILPPFSEEHEELRESVGRFVAAEVAPHVDEWEEAREFPRELFNRCGELGFLGLKFPERYGGQGGDLLHDAVWIEELSRAGGSGGVAAGLNAHAQIAMPPVFNFGTSEQRERWIVPGDQGRAHRGARDHRAGRRIGRGESADLRAKGGRRLRRQRRQDLHHQRRTGRLPRLRGEDDRGRRPSRHLVPRAGAGHARLRGLSQAGEDGLARLRHRGAQLHGRRGAQGEPARGRERGLLPDHGQLPVGAALDGDRRRGRDAEGLRRRRSPTPRSARHSGGRSAASRRYATSSPRWRPGSRPRGR